MVQRSRMALTDRDGELLTLPDISRRTGIGMRLLRRAQRSGELPTYQIGTWARVRWVDVIAWLERHRRPATEASG